MAKNEVWASREGLKKRTAGREGTVRSTINQPHFKKIPNSKTLQHNGTQLCERNSRKIRHLNGTRMCKPNFLKTSQPEGTRMLKPYVAKITQAFGTWISKLDLPKVSQLDFQTQSAQRHQDINIDLAFKTSANRSPMWPGCLSLTAKKSAISLAPGYLSLTFQKSARMF